MGVNMGDIIKFLESHMNDIAEAILLLLAMLSIIFRLTPTEKDDGFLAKVDMWVNKIFDFFKLPNNLKKKDEDKK